MKFRTFFREKAVYLVLLAFIFAAAFSSFWAIRNMVRDLGPAAEQEENTWIQPDAPVAQEKEDVPIDQQPKTDSASPSESSQSAAASQPAQQSAAAPEASAQPSEQAAASSVWPVSGEIIQSCSGDELVYNETLKDWRTHNGTDIACAEGAEVKAVSAGKVAAAYQDTLWGWTVEVESGELLYRYCGLESDGGKKIGDAVAAGDVLGKVGVVEAEQEMEPHLHFEILKSGAYCDPEELMD